MDQKPTRKRTTPAVTEARGFLLRGIESGTFAPGMTLPPIRALSRMAGVSLVSMWKAAHELAGEGVLWARPGHPLRVRTPPDQETEETRSAAYMPSAQDRWQFVKKRIQHAIVNGRYGPGQMLPPLKVIASEYGASHLMVRRALAALAEEFLIVPQSRGYAVAGFRAPSSPAKKIVLIVSFDEKSRHINSDFATEFARELERECSRSGLSLQILAYRHFGGDEFFDFSNFAPCEIRDEEDVFGYISIVTGPDSGWEHGLRILAKIDKPVALVDGCGNINHARTIMKSHRRFQLFSCGISPKPGREMGRFLLSLGHRNIAYITPYQTTSAWSMNRYRGLCDAYELVDEGSVVEIGSSNASWNELLKVAVADSRIDDVVACYQALRRGIRPQFAHWLDRVLHADIGPLFWATFHARVAEICEELFERALGERDVTAWVAANDSIAVHALDFMRRRGVACPADLTLVGFDDVQDALENKITTYNFNVRALVDNALRFALNPVIKTGRTRLPTIEVDGLIIQRGTSGKPRSSPRNR